MKTNIATSFFSSQKLLETFFKEGEQEFKKIKALLFSDLYRSIPYQPDHIIKNTLHEFFSDKIHGQLVLSNLDELAGHLIFRDSKIYVKSSCFEIWQNLILKVPPLQIISYKIYKEAAEKDHIKIEELITNCLEKTAIPTIYEPILNHLIDKNGLDEVHMHLNGSTETDFVWQDALRQPVEFYKTFKKTKRNGEVVELYLQLGNLVQDDLYRLLRLAASLRDRMIRILDGENNTEDSCFNILLKIGKINYISNKYHPMYFVENNKGFNDIQFEALFMARVYERLAQKNSKKLAFLLHFYMLISAFLHRLLVQQNQQVGFDQFQKITINDLREVTEKKYNARFSQLQGMYDNHLNTLEGRFAPKATRSRFEALIREISRGYSALAEPSYELKLVPHFIKQLDNRIPSKIFTYRDLVLRLQNNRMLDVLLELLERGHTQQANFVRQHLVGFDAAANELHAPPEVFSPIYRKLAFHGFSNFTYHVGEDFVHLLSGMRAIYEAIEFLELKPGNRIGHATAIGIEPELWLKRSSKRIYIRKEEWLDNLVFVYHLCQGRADFSYLCYRLEEPIADLFCKIYGQETHRPVSQLIRAWLFRKYDPAVGLGWKQSGLFNGFLAAEQKVINKAKSVTRDINTAYHSASVIEAGRKLVEIETGALFSVQELRLLQNLLLEIVNQKQLAIEALPSSNVRISYYKSYNEHHLLRWLGFTHAEDPKISVVIGSDDTGVFMTNLRNEYAHVYQMIESAHGSEAAAESIEKLQSNAKAFGFSTRQVER